MNQIVHFKHKDITVALLELSENDNSILRLQCFDPENMPYLRQMSVKEMNFWWRNRAIPDNRKELSKILKNSKCDNSLQFMSKNLALSLSDCYWVCPTSLSKKWEEVNLFQNFKEVSFKDKAGNDFSNNPNGSLNGSMDKEAYFENNEWILKKYRETHLGEQCINEVFSNLINEKQGFTDYVKYRLQFKDNKCESCTCRFFTNAKLEFVAAYIFTAYKSEKNFLSNYEQYINLCKEFGLDEQDVRSFMDYQTLLDFVMTNTDRHYQNFGVLRDPDTLKISGLAPVFDCGNSMFYKDCYNMTANEILNIPISSMTKYEEKMLEYVTDKNAIDVEKLPTKEETKEFYIENKIDEYRADIISNNYQKKIEMLNKFQKGYKITRYTVKDWDSFLDR
ncbi:MAG: HipA domain-containing protein [Lachnospiraceae bacterium]|nr:HipA domain-containing protein [Lachnospiraceae bacterium]